jgi:hypothetical protein
MQVRFAPLRTVTKTGYTLTVFGDSGSYLGMLDGVVRITTDVPGEEQIEIGFGGRVADIRKFKGP